jgi:hypothetical protein
MIRIPIEWYRTTAAQVVQVNLEALRDTAYKAFRVEYP